LVTKFESSKKNSRLIGLQICQKCIDVDTLLIGFYVLVSSLSVLVIYHTRQTKFAVSLSTFNAR